MPCLAATRAVLTLAARAALTLAHGAAGGPAIPEPPAALVAAT